MGSVAQLGNGPTSSGSLRSQCCDTFLGLITQLLVGSYALSHSIGMMTSKTYLHSSTLCLYNSFLSICEALCRGTQDISAADHPTFLWPQDIFTLDDVYKGFLRGHLLVMVRVFILFVSS